MRICRLAVLLIMLGVSIFDVRSSAAATVSVLTGTIEGAAYKIEVPANWNGTLVLYSHGAVNTGQPNPAVDVGDPVTGAYLLGQGYALAGSSYSHTGWAIQWAMHDQIALLDYFTAAVGAPKRTIAWGHSQGGTITAGLVQEHPDRFAGAIPMCGVLGGMVAYLNQSFDQEFVFKTLLAPSSTLRLTGIADPTGNVALAQQLVTAARATPAGRARLALAAAVGNAPGWFDPASAEPAPDDLAARGRNQSLWLQFVVPRDFGRRAELEARAGGNPSWNTSVDYRVLLDGSIDRDEVRALYEQSGVSLDDDLATLAAAPRIAADPAAVDYVSRYTIFDGHITIPVLTMHTTGDGLVPVEHERAYARAVQDAGDAGLLRQTFVHRAGHCAFTPAETIAAFQALTRRLDTGQWGDADQPDALNPAAATLGPGYNVTPLFGLPPSSAHNAATPPAFVRFAPSIPLRPYDSRSSASVPARLFGTATGSLPGDSGGSFHYYRLARPSGSTLTLTLTYGPFDAPQAHAVGIDVYQNGVQLGSAAGQATGLGDAANSNVASLTVAPTAEGGPVLIQVFNYGAGAVTYTLASG